MALFGPRLDEPTAIGDEGRPRATSLTIASLVVLLTVLAASYTAGVLDRALVFLTLGGLVTVGLALLNHDRFFALFLGQLCYVLGGTALIGLLTTLLVTTPEYGLLFTGFTLALTGLMTSWADVANRGSTKNALYQGALSYVSMMVWFVLLLVIVAVVLVVWSLLTTRAAAIPPTPSLVVFLLVVSVSALLVWVGTRWLPFSQLTPRDERRRLEQRVGRVRLATGLLAIAAFVSSIVAAVVAVTGGFDLLYAILPPVQTLVTGLSSPFLLGAPLLLGFGVLVAALGAVVLRRLTRPKDARANRLLASVAAGLVFSLLLLPFVFSYIPLDEFWRVAVAVLVVVFGPLALFAVGLTFLLGLMGGFLPDRAGGPAVAATGMVIATVGTALTGRVPSVLVFACATAGMVAWDVSAFGLGVTADLGHLPETRRLELFHGILGVGVGVAVVGILTGLDVLRTTVAAGIVAGPAIMLAVVAVLLLLIPVRG